MNITIIETTLNKQSIVARELYTALGLNPTHYNRWFAQQSEMFIENVDYILLAINGERVHGGQNIVNHAITIEMAKHIALMSKTDMGKRYRNELIELERKVQELPQDTRESLGLSREAIMQSAWEHERDMYIAKIDKDHAVAIKDIEQRMAALDQREYVLVDGMHVRVDMTASKLSLPLMTITEVVKGTEFDAQLANGILYKLKFIKRKGNQWVIDTAGKQYGRDVTSSTTAKISMARWFKGEEANILKILRANV